jgi:hypothetical protein
MVFVYTFDHPVQNTWPKYVTLRSIVSPFAARCHTLARIFGKTYQQDKV